MENTMPKSKTTLSGAKKNILTPPKALATKKATKTLSSKEPLKEAKSSTVPKFKPVKVDDAFIEIKNLTKYYINSKSEIVTALEDISFTLPRTGFVYLKGESGSGKSTLLNILGALDSYDKGDMIVEGLSFKNLSLNVLDDWRANQTAFVFQDFNLLYDFTVAENIRLGSNFAGMDVSDEQINDVLSKVGLEGFEKRHIAQLSGGERQRVSIARALVKTPKILLVDEPTGQINLESAERVFSILKDISRETLVVCVSYDPPVEKYVDRAITLSKGRIINDIIIKRSKEDKIEIQDSGLSNFTKKQTYIECSTNHILRIGTRNVTGRRKWRTIVLVLLTSFSLLFGSVLYMLAGYNKFEALAKNVEMSSSEVLIFETDDPYNMYLEYSETTDESVMQRLDFVKNNYITSIIEMTAPANNNTVGGYNVFGQKILHGQYPISLDTGVVITDYLASKIVKSDNSFVTEEEFAGLIGERIFYFDNKLQIFNIDDFSDIVSHTPVSIAAIVESGYKNLDKDSAQYKFNEENIYKVIHAAPKFHEIYTTITNKNTVIIDEDEDNLILSDVTFYKWSAFQVYNNSRAEIDKFRDTNDSLITSLADNAILISSSLVEELSGSHRFRSGNLDRFYSFPQIINTDERIIVFPDLNFIPDVCKQIEFPPSGVVLAVDGRNVAELTELFENLNKNYKATLMSASSNEIIEFSEKVYIFKTAVLIFTIVSIMLTMALFYNFITLTIIDNKKNIGVLRSLGASGGDIAAIFSTTIGIIIIACTLLTSILSVITAVIINLVVLNSMNMPFHIIVFNPLLFVFIFLVCVFIGVVATAVPVFRYSKQSPINQIKGNRIYRLKDTNIKILK